MGKRVKKKTRSVPKERRVPMSSHKMLPEQHGDNAETPEHNEFAFKERGACSHINGGINLDKISAKLDTSEPFKCEDCRGSALGRRANKGKNKHGKKGGANSSSESKAIWICLECGHFSCGGIGLPTIPNSHAIRHAKQNHHALVIQFENPQLLWCFPCSKLVNSEKWEDNGEHKNVIHEVAKMLKARPGEGSSLNVEDVWFGSGGGTSAIKSDYSISCKADEKVGYSVRGLVNLGNTCFFNSIMQNLFTINKLRGYLFESDESVGPISVSLRKLFLETSTAAGVKGVINPRSLFGSLCSKSPQFKGYQQHDSHELLRCLLDCLSSEELSARKQVISSLVDGTTSIAKPTFVDAIFGGQLSSTVSCLECGHSSIIYESFLDLSLPIPTKRPPSKRPQAVTRGKKIKPPPKQGGKIRSKINKNAPILLAESVSDQSNCVNSSTEVQHRAQPGEDLDDSAMSLPIDLNTVALDMGLTHNDMSDGQEPKYQQKFDDVCEPSVSSDALTWLDYLEPNPMSSNYDVGSETLELAANQGIADNSKFQNDVSFSITSVSITDSNLGCSVSITDSNLGCEGGVSTMPLHNPCQFNYLEKGILSHQQNSFSQCVEKQNEISPSDEKLYPNDSLTKEVVDADTGDNSSCGQVCLTDSTVEVGSSGRDNENPRQLKESKVLVLPYKEDVSSSRELLTEGIELSSTSVGDDQGGSQEFDGFGDLFNEPEVILELGPSEQATGAVTNGVVGNSSDSDPDEVDHSNAPVSVESCLACFTKPEFLSKDEHAWQCDNCSKVLHEVTRRKLRNLKAEIVPNGCDDNGPLDGCDKHFHDVFHGSNYKVLPHNEEIHDIGNGMLRNHQKTELNMIACQSKSQVSIMLNSCNKPLDCSSLNCQILDSGCGNRDTDSSMLAENDLSPEKCESEVTEAEEVGSKSLRVKRDATKSILINKAPFLLTIHLKRFSQDARGRLSKLNGHVNFRETIDLKPYMHPRSTNGEKHTYRLVGAVEHSGSMRSGHYVAYVRGGQGDGTVWYYASDTHVRQVSLEEVLSCDAYILFYEET